MKIAIFEAEDWEEQACASLEGRHAVRCTRAALSGATVGDFADAEVVSPFITSRLDADVIDQLPALRLIATRSAGYDHIDLSAYRFLPSHKSLYSVYLKEIDSVNKKLLTFNFTPVVQPYQTKKNHSYPDS